MRPDQEDLIEKVYREYFNELEIYAYALLRDRSNAQVAVQEAFHTACKKIDDFTNSPNQIGWLKLVVKNIARNMMKRKNREKRLVMPLADLLDEPGASGPHDFEFWEHCKALLSPEEFDLIKSIIIDNVSYIQKAEELNITMWACYKRVDRALQKLRRGLENEE